MKSKASQTISTDLLIIGGGAAGCFAALKAREAGVQEILIVDKGHVGKSGCATFGAGSFKGFIPGEDPYEIWFGKAVEAGCFMNDQDWTQVHLNEVYERVKELESWGVEFERNPDGSYRRIEGQGSSDLRPIKTLMFHGPQLMHQLRQTLHQRGIPIVDRVMVTHLLHARGKPAVISGALGFHLESGDRSVFRSKATILTSGGQSYKAPYAFHKMVTGDGHIMALEAGAELSNYEFSLHHLSYAGFDTTGMNVLQGLGGTFLNRLGESFMEKYDPEHGSRANLNTISAAMAMEVKEGRGPLSMDFSRYTRESTDLLKRVLPILHLAFTRSGIIRGDQITPRLEWMSVNSGNVGFGGGVRITLSCETNLEGLLAAGDATSGPASGVEGFCAYAIPFATTSGARAGLRAAAYIKKIKRPYSTGESQVRQKETELFKPLLRSHGVEPDVLTLRVQEILFPMGTYLLRHGDRLRKGIEEVADLKSNLLPCLKAYDPHYLRMAVEAKNMLLCAECFLKAALAREESRGSHLREDFPFSENQRWLKWIILQQVDENLRLRKEPIPIHRFPLRPPVDRVKHPIIEANERYH
jgi:succinate dehydrogenase / fumarate reductase, flavoprotein subunit